MKAHSHSFPTQSELTRVRRVMQVILTELDLSLRVTVEEIEDALFLSKEIADTPLILGICARAIELNDVAGLEQLIPLFIQWKHLLPEESLGGLSPYEHEHYFPRGEIEHTVIEDLISAYLDAVSDDALHELFGNSAQSFTAYSASFLNLIPSYQPFTDATRPMTHRELIERERLELAIPSSENITIGFEPFVLRTSLDLVQLTDTIMARYYKTVDVLVHAEYVEKNKKNISTNNAPQATTDVNEEMLATACTLLSELEPFMRCTSQAAFFYLHFGTALLLLGDTEFADELIEEAYSIDPLLAEHFASGVTPSSIVVTAKATQHTESAREHVT